MRIASLERSVDQKVKILHSEISAGFFGMEMLTDLLLSDSVASYKLCDYHSGFLYR